MKHLNEIDYPGGFDKLAEDLGNLRYDTLTEFLEKLSNKIEKDARADRDRERHQLANQLTYSAKHIRNAWKICASFMKAS
jgi:hypothetical protein